MQLVAAGREVQRNLLAAVQERHVVGEQASGHCGAACRADSRANAARDGEIQVGGYQAQAVNGVGLQQHVGEHRKRALARYHAANRGERVRQRFLGALDLHAADPPESAPCRR